MKYVNLVFCVILLLFVAVQYNDPDGSLWMIIYGIPALWCAIAALRLDWLLPAPVTALMLLCTAVAVAGTVYYWPGMSDWWMQEVWWEEETAREGMGAMIVLVAMLTVLVSFWLHKKNQ